MQAIRDVAGLAVVLAVAMAVTYVAGVAGLVALLFSGLVALCWLDPAGHGRAGQTGGQS